MTLKEWTIELLGLLLWPIGIFLDYEDEEDE